MTATDCIPCTGDVVTGDTICWIEAVFSGGSFGRFRRAAKYMGDRNVKATVLKDSYGRLKQQHTFTLLVIASSGCQPLEAGSTVTRKGRNIYRNGTTRTPWTDESARRAVADEKHARGTSARAIRTARMEQRQ